MNSSHHWGQSVCQLFPDFHLIRIDGRPVLNAGTLLVQFALFLRLAYVINLNCFLDILGPADMPQWVVEARSIMDFYWILMLSRPRMSTTVVWTCPPAKRSAHRNRESRGYTPALCCTKSCQASHGTRCPPLMNMLFQPLHPAAAKSMC